MRFPATCEGIVRKISTELFNESSHCDKLIIWQFFFFMTFTSLSLHVYQPWSSLVRFPNPHFQVSWRIWLGPPRSPRSLHVINHGPPQPTFLSPCLSSSSSDRGLARQLPRTWVSLVVHLRSWVTAALTELLPLVASPPYSSGSVGPYCSLLLRILPSCAAAYSLVRLGARNLQRRELVTLLLHRAGFCNRGINQLLR